MCKIELKKVSLLGIFLLLLVRGGFVEAAGTDQFDYPELSVVPRASDRLHSEAEEEGGRSATAFLPFQISALTTLTAGAVGLNDPVNPSAGYVGMGVGGAWLVFTTAMSFLYRPYSSAAAKIQTLPKGTVREQLAKERAAEEEIVSAERLGEELRWMSIITNLAASIYMLSRFGNSNNGSSSGGSGNSNMTQGVAVGAAVFSLTPLIFRTHWYYVEDEQEEYKKKIYAPVASATVFPNAITHSYDPGMALSFRF